MTQSYVDKLRDPRWQKKRLEIFQRDNFTCQECGNDKHELHIHHEKYYGDPWDAPNHLLKTVCSICHKKAHKLPLEERDIRHQQTNPSLTRLREKYSGEYLITEVTEKDIKHNNLNSLRERYSESAITLHSIEIEGKNYYSMGNNEKNILIIINDSSSIYGQNTIIIRISTFINSFNLYLTDVAILNLIRIDIPTIWNDLYYFNEKKDKSVFFDKIKREYNPELIIFYDIERVQKYPAYTLQRRHNISFIMIDNSFLAGENNKMFLFALENHFDSFSKNDIYIIPKSN